MKKQLIFIALCLAAFAARAQDTEPVLVNVEGSGLGQAVQGNLFFMGSKSRLAIEAASLVENLSFSIACEAERILGDGPIGFKAPSMGVRVNTFSSPNGAFVNRTGFVYRGANTLTIENAFVIGTGGCLGSAKAGLAFTQNGSEDGTYAQGKPFLELGGNAVYGGIAGAEGSVLLSSARPPLYGLCLYRSLGGIVVAAGVRDFNLTQSYRFIALILNINNINTAE